MSSPCPECGTDVEFANSPVINEVVECRSCVSELEVIATNPVMLALAPEVEEDWGE